MITLSDIPDDIIKVLISNFSVLTDLLSWRLTSKYWEANQTLRIAELQFSFRGLRIKVAALSDSYDRQQSWITPSKNIAVLEESIAIFREYFDFVKANCRNNEIDPGEKNTIRQLPVKLLNAKFLETTDFVLPPLLGISGYDKETLFIHSAVNKNCGDSIANYTANTECIENLNFDKDITEELVSALLARCVPIPNSVRTLSFRNSAILKIPDHVCSLPHLKSIFIKSPCSAPIPENIGNAVKIKDIWVVGAKGVPTPHSKLENRSIPQSIRKCQNLRSLGLVGYGLTSPPEILNNLTNLTSLSLAKNPLNNFDIIWTMVNLDKLFLSHVGLEYIPEGISNLVNLGELNLSNNSITSISDNCSLWMCPYLISLELNNNKIEYVSANVARLEHLNTLNLSYNLIMEIPEIIGEMESLGEFYIRCNPIKRTSQSVIDIATDGDKLTVEDVYPNRHYSEDDIISDEQLDISDNFVDEDN